MSDNVINEEIKESEDSSTTTEEIVSVDPELKTEKDIDEYLEKLASTSTAKQEIETFTADDIKRAFKTSPVFGGSEDENEDSEEEIDPKFKISDEAVAKLLEVMNKMNAKEDINVYSSLPQEVQDIINQFLAKQGMSGYSVQSNTMRNTVARQIMEEFINNVSMQKSLYELNTQIEEGHSVLSGMFKDEENERNARIQKLLEVVPEDSPKRQILEDVAKNIYDSYDLKQFKEFAPNCGRIKSIEIEKPKQRVFRRFEGKYERSPYHMYSLDMVYDIMQRHNPREDHGNLLFLIAFCKMCLNYSPNNEPQHAFMYYTIYNIVVLDLYKGDIYTDHAEKFLKNVNDIEDILVKKFNRF